MNRLLTIEVFPYRIICTHHTKYLYDADLIIVVDKGSIVMSGTPDEILNSSEIRQLSLETEDETHHNDTDKVWSMIHIYIYI